jgi:hypothetical protein
LAILWQSVNPHETKYRRAAQFRIFRHADYEPNGTQIALSEIIGCIATRNQLVGDSQTIEPRDP